jgi:hypothetical protein
MKKIVEIESGQGLDSLLGEKVLLLCANYFYTGKLSGVNDTCVELENASLVYETGPWTEKGYKDAQALPNPWFVSRTAIESFGASK